MFYIHAQTKKHCFLGHFISLLVNHETRGYEEDANVSQPVLPVQKWRYTKIIVTTCNIHVYQESSEQFSTLVVVDLHFEQQKPPSNLDPKRPLFLIQSETLFKAVETTINPIIIKMGLNICMVLWPGVPATKSPKPTVVSVITHT